MGEKQGFQKMTLSPTTGHTVAVKPQLPVYKRRGCRICCGVSLVIVLALGIIAIALSQTIFKFRDPTVSINSLKLENIHVQVDILSFSVELNVTVAADVRVDNPNHYSFRYNNSTMLLTYHGQSVGDIALGAGEIRAQKTVDLPTTITVEAIKIVENQNVLSDVTKDVATFGLYAAIPGRIDVANIYKKHVETTMNCTLDVFISNQTLKDSVCSRKVKL